MFYFLSLIAIMLIRSSKCNPHYLFFYGNGTPTGRMPEVKNKAVYIVIRVQTSWGNLADISSACKAPEGWRTPGRFAYFRIHRVARSVLECGGPPPLLELGFVLGLKLQRFRACALQQKRVSA